MAEATIFILVVGGVLTAGLFYAGWTNVHPIVIFLPIMILLIPGFYAAFVSGPFVPSAQKRKVAMLKLANIRPSDIVYDLGFGDGRLIFAASNKAKRAIGIELSVPLYLFGLLRKLFSRSKVWILYGNIWKQDYRDADVVFCYLLPKAMHRFYSEIWPSLKPGTRVISNAFPIHETQPAKTEEHVYLYIK